MRRFPTKPDTSDENANTPERDLVVETGVGPGGRLEAAAAAQFRGGQDIPRPRVSGRGPQRPEREGAASPGACGVGSRPRGGLCCREAVLVALGAWGTEGSGTEGWGQLPLLGLPFHNC